MPEICYSDTVNIQNRVGVVYQPPHYDESLARASVRQAVESIGVTWDALVQPGEQVVLKPNFIRESHTNRPGEWEQIITHGTIIAAVALEVAAAMQGRGTITIADAPQTDSDFDKICERGQIPQLRERLRRTFPGLSFDVIDLRREVWRTINGVIVERHKLPEDPRGYTLVNLGQHSCFHGKSGRFYGADYDTAFTAVHHSNGTHEYLISRSVMDADVFINLPKLKTHKKVGVTLSLKNLVGINADKNWLPHHTDGDPAQGGDEHPMPGPKHRLERRLVKLSHRAIVAFPGAGSYLLRKARKPGLRVFGDSENVVRCGNWYGNDTVWRMCLDLNKLLAYGNPDGTLREGVAQNRKRHYVLVDGIVAGEGRGPIDPDPVPAGLLAFGTHAPSVDAACAYLMGFDPARIPIIANAFGCKRYPLAPGGLCEFEIRSNRPEWNGRICDLSDVETLHFKPHFGWTNQIERTARHVLR